MQLSVGCGRYIERRALLGVVSILSAGWSIECGSLLGAVGGIFECSLLFIECSSLLGAVGGMLSAGCKLNLAHCWSAGW